MKRRKNPIYKGQSNRVSTGTGDRKVVDAFYAALNKKLRSEDEIEIIPPEQVNPTHDLQDQACIIVDYCIRKILPEVTGLYRWGDEVTPQLRALAPVVDQETAEAAEAAAADADADAAYAANVAAYVARAAYPAYADAAFYAYNAAHLAAYTANAAYYTANAAKCVYHALVASVEAGDEAAYNRIIELTNEMLESL